jgi:hypothetical protein
MDVASDARYVLRVDDNDARISLEVADVEGQDVGEPMGQHGSD